MLTILAQSVKDVPPVDKYSQFVGQMCTVQFYGPGGLKTQQMKLIGLNKRSLKFDIQGGNIAIDKEDIANIEMYDPEDRIRARLATLGDYAPE
jgi:hypothetical protein